MALSIQQRIARQVAVHRLVRLDVFDVCDRLLSDADYAQEICAQGMIASSFVVRYGVCCRHLLRPRRLPCLGASGARQTQLRVAIQQRLRAPARRHRMADGNPHDRGRRDEGPARVPRSPRVHVRTRGGPRAGSGRTPESRPLARSRRGESQVLSGHLPTGALRCGYAPQSNPRACGTRPPQTLGFTQLSKEQRWPSHESC